MAEVRTPWGYTATVDGADALPPLIGLAEFRALMPGLSATDAQALAVLNAVSQAIRNRCGWHVGPSLGCAFTGHSKGRDLYLPSMCVSSVTSLEIGGAEIDASQYWWSESGIVRLKSGAFPEGLRNVECAYTAGTSDAAVAQVAAQVAANALVAAPGVREERAGDVSIAYNQTGSGITGGVSLLGRDLDAIAPYILARA